jgi:hypothetical protein
MPDFIRLTGRVGRFALLSSILVSAVLPPSAYADTVVDASTERALVAKFRQSSPSQTDFATNPYPGAVFDPVCSAQESAPRTVVTVYCFYSRDPLDRVTAYAKEVSKPHPGVNVIVRQRDVSDENSRVKVRGASVISYWVNAAR